MSVRARFLDLQADDRGPAALNTNHASTYEQLMASEPEQEDGGVRRNDAGGMRMVADAGAAMEAGAAVASEAPIQITN